MHRLAAFVPQIPQFVSDIVPAAAKAPAAATNFEQLIQELAAAAEPPAIAAKPTPALKPVLLKPSVPMPSVPIPVKAATVPAPLPAPAHTAAPRTTEKVSKPTLEPPAPIIETPVPIPPVPIKPKPAEVVAANNPAPQAVKDAATPEAAPRIDVALQVRIMPPAQQPVAHEEAGHAGQAGPAAIAASPQASASASAPAERTDSRPPRRATAQLKIQQPTPAAEPEADDTAPVDAAPIRPPIPAPPTPNVPDPKAPEPTRPHIEAPSVPASVAPAPTPALTIPAPAPTNAEINVPQPPPPASVPTPPQIPPASPSQVQEAQEPMLPKPAAPQPPLKSLALEFTPDGAGDVRLRLSERAGEVHISLHSSDSSLASCLHEGVHDLVGSLAKAGYDAEAWTPNQGRQNYQRQPDVPRKTRSGGSPASGAEDFDNMLQQPIPIQEVS